MSEKYLIFGATGSIGSSLAEQLKVQEMIFIWLQEMKQSLRILQKNLDATSTVADVLEDKFIEKVKNDISE